MELEYREILPDKHEFFRLFEKTGWNDDYHMDEDELFRAVKNSWYCLSVYSDGELVGFGRIICDSVVHALILDLIVEKGMRRKGVGSEILGRLVDKCKDEGIRDIQLFCAEGMSEFYEENGFVARPVDAPGMEYR